MNIKPFYSGACAALVVLASIYGGTIKTVNAAPSAVAADYSVLPETFGNRPDLTPNILIVLDTSGSMSGFFLEEGGTFATNGGRADLPLSRSAQSREAIRAVLASNVGNFNVGLMTFGGGASRRGVGQSSGDNDTVANCNGYTKEGEGILSCVNAGTTNRISRYRKSNAESNRKGLLVSELKPLDQDHLTELNTRLAIEPRRPTYVSDQNSRAEEEGVDCTVADGCPFYQVGITSFWSDIGTARNGIRDPLQDGTAISVGGTPLAGSLNSARAYLTGSVNVGARTNFVVNDDFTETEVHPNLQPATGTGNFEFPALNLNLATECRPDTFVFLLTDGLPSGASFVPFENSGATRANNIDTTVNEASLLLDSGIQTWVFGFALPDLPSSNERMAVTRIARAGSGGTQAPFFASNAAELTASLNDALAQISSQGGSSSGLSIITSSVQATGAVAQALYVPERTFTTQVTDSGGNLVDVTDTAYWTGSLSMFFIDENGDLREDRNNNGVLDPATDTTFELEFDEMTLTTRAMRSTGETISLDDLEPIWEASEILSSYDQTATGLIGTSAVSSFEIQRPYGIPASNTVGFRHILTSIDGVTKDFVFSSGSGIDETNFTRLALDSAGDDVDADGDRWDSDDQAQAIQRAKDLIAYTRGKEGVVTPQGTATRALRDRTLDGTSFILGDILHSTAVQVGVPNDARFLVSPETSSTYAFFVDALDGEFDDSSGNNEPRRRVVYVGGNDGMLHAFNAGFYNPNDVSFTSPDHDLGAELWAYVPSALLPHLKWVAEAGNNARPYTASQHISFMDGPVQAFDVQLWDPALNNSEDSEHPGGWGTIIVAGMRLGGGTFPEIDDDANEATPTVTTRSSYVVLDVTNPESPPVVLAELTDEELGFTTSVPTVIRQNTDQGEVNDTNTDDWFLVFGSGPTDIQTSTSTQTGTIYKYNLSASVGTPTFEKEDIGVANSFIGDISFQDWNSDSFDESIYFGSVIDSIEDPAGQLFRLATTDTDTGASVLDMLFDADQPIPFKVTGTLDPIGNQWLFFGTGRLLDTDDLAQDDQNTFYGIKDPLIFIEEGSTEGQIDAGSLNTSITVNDLVDVTNLRVMTNGDLERTPLKGGAQITAGDPPAPVTTFEGLRAFNQSDESFGWKSDFDAPAAGDTFSLRSSAEGLLFRNFLFYTSFAPPNSDGDACTNEFGMSSLTAVDFSTGTAFFADGFDGLLDNAGGFLNDTVTVGAGIAATSALFVVPNNDGRSGVKIKVPLSTGEVGDVSVPLPPSNTGRKSWTEIKAE